MAKKPAKKSPKSDHEDMPDVEQEDLDNGEDEIEEEEPDDAPEETPQPEEPPPEQGEGEPANPPAGSRKITIEGDGELLLGVGGETRSIPRGVEVEVGDDILTTLEGSSIKFKRSKK